MSAHCRNAAPGKLATDGGRSGYAARTNFSNHRGQGKGARVSALNACFAASRSGFGGGHTISRWRLL
jgi:hypothetical protein